jgi:hypothetical protein
MILILSLLSLGCPNASQSVGEVCPEGNCEVELTPIEPGFHAFPDAPSGIPVSWIAKDGSWKIVVVHENGLSLGEGRGGNKVQWETLVEWSSSPSTSIQSFDALENTDGGIIAVFSRGSELWFYDSKALLQVNGVIDSNAGSAPRPAMTLDSLGTIHVSYYHEPSGTLKYANLQESGWNIESVPLPTSPCPTEDCGETQEYGAYSDIGIQGGSPVVVFYDQSRGNLCFSTRLAETWVGQIMDGEFTETGANTGDVGKWPSLSVDEKANLSVAYYGVTSSDLRFAYPSNSELQVKKVDLGQIETPEGIITETSVGPFAQLLQSAGGQPVIFYLDSYTPTIRRAERKGSVWSLSRLPLDRPGGFHMKGSVGEEGDKLLVFQTWKTGNDLVTPERSLMAWYEPIP